MYLTVIEKRIRVPGCLLQHPVILRSRIAHMIPEKDHDHFPVDCPEIIDQFSERPVRLMETCHKIIDRTACSLAVHFRLITDSARLIDQSLPISAMILHRYGKNELPFFVLFFLLILRNDLRKKLGIRDIAPDRIIHLKGFLKIQFIESEPAIGILTIIIRGSVRVHGCRTVSLCFQITYDCGEPVIDKAPVDHVILREKFSAETGQELELADYRAATEDMRKKFSVGSFRAERSVTWNDILIEGNRIRAGDIPEGLAHHCNHDRRLLLCPGRYSFRLPALSDFFIYQRRNFIHSFPAVSLRPGSLNEIIAVFQKSG